MKSILLLFSRHKKSSKNLVFLLVFFISFFSSTETFASHAAGMDITYKYAGNPGRQVTVTVITDYFGSEASWDITDAAGNVYAQGGPYTNSCITNDRTHTVTICLPTNTSLEL